MRQQQSNKNTHIQQQQPDQALQFFAAKQSPEMHQQEVVAGLNSSFLRGFSQASNQRPKSRQNSPSPVASVSLEQQQLHKIVKLKKQTSLLDGSSTFLSTSSPKTAAKEGELPQPQPNRQTHQYAKNMRISQQRILRESSLDNSLVQQQTAGGDPNQSLTIRHNRANTNQYSASTKQGQPRTLSSEPQDGLKLVKKVSMRGSQRGSAMGNANTASMGPVRQSSLTHRQGPILQSGPHIRSKSSAIGTDIALQMQQLKPSRKSNSRGRATPQGRLSQQHTVGHPPSQMFGASQQQPAQQQFKKVKKTTEQKSSLTITSPKDSSGGGGDLNTSMPLPLSKSQNKVTKQLDKSQQQSQQVQQKTARQQPASTRQQQPLGSTTSQQQQQLNQNLTRSTGTPSGATYQHTRKQSSTRHRSNSKKRGSINTSIRRQMEKSPGLVTVQTQQTKQSTATKAHGYGASIHWSKEQNSLVQNQLLVDQQMAALAASAFSQQQNPAHQQSLQSQSSILPIQSAVPISSLRKGSVEENQQLFLAVQSTLGHTQGHRLTPLVGGNKSNRRQSNERKNKSLAVQHLDAKSIEALMQTKSKNQQSDEEPAQTLIGIELQEEQDGELLQQQLIQTDGTQEDLIMKSNAIVAKNLATQHQQWSAHPTTQHFPNSQFSSFTKDHAGIGEARHASAQKVLRPKNSLMSSQQQTAAERSESPNSHLRRGGAIPQQQQQHQLSRAQVHHANSINEVGSSQVYMQQNAQFMQLIRQSRQQPTQTQPAFNSRMSQNTLHQQSATSSAQSSRTTHQMYMKQPIKKSQLISGGGNSNQVKSMSSRTMQSITSQGQTPYEPNSGIVIQNTYGSTSAQQMKESAEKQLRNKGTFKDFRPKTQMGAVSTADSRSQQMLDRDVSGLSPEPKAEIILSKNQIQRAARSKIQGQQSQISIQKNQNLQKLKFSQIQQANASLQKDMAKKVIKSQRQMRGGDTAHAKSFSNGQTAGQNLLFFESKNISALNANYLNQMQQPASNSVTHQEAVAKELGQQARPFAAKSASKVNPKHSNSMVQNWIYSADQQSDESLIQNNNNNFPKKTASTYRQIGGIGHTTRQKFGQKPTFGSQEKQPNNTVREMVPQQLMEGQGNNPQYQQQFQQLQHQPSSKSQRSKNKANFSNNEPQANLNMYVPFHPATIEEGQTHSQRQLVNTNNIHQWSQELVPQHLKSVQVHQNPPNQSAETIVGMQPQQLGPAPTVFKPLKSKLLQGSRSSTIESILQAEQSRQKVLGPMEQQPQQQKQPLKVQKKGTAKKGTASLSTDLNNHNAYANNAEDYFKKTPNGTKTPADKPTKKLKKVNGSKTSTKSVAGGQAQSQHVSGKASPHVQSDLGDNRLGIEQQTSQQLETRSVLTATGPPLSFVSQGSGNQPLTSTQSHHAGINDVKSIGMSRSRLSQFVVQSNMVKTSQSMQQQSSFNASVSVPSKTPNPSSHTSIKKTVLNPNQVKIINQHDIVKRQAKNHSFVADDFHSGKVSATSSKPGVGKSPLTQSELMRKKNQVKMVGASALSTKQQQNLTMQHLLQEGQLQQRPSAGGTGTVLQKDPDTTLISMSNASKVQRASPSMIPNGKNTRQSQIKAKGGQQTSGILSSQLKSTEQQIYASQNQKQNSQQTSKPNSQQRQYQEYLQNQQMSEKRSARPLQQMESEARSMTALALSDGLSSQQSIRKFNKNQPQRSVSDFGINQQNGPPSTNTVEMIGVFQENVQEPTEINELMPQRLNLANCIEKVDKKLGKNEMLISSQLSTNTSQNSSFYEEKASKSRFGNNQQLQVMTPVVTFQAHDNSVIGLQATNMGGTSGQFASFSKDNSVKVWSLATQKATQLISNNRAANMNLPLKVTLKRQIKNQARPSQKLSSFSFMQMQDGTSEHHQRSVLVTGCTDKTLRLYDLEYPEPHDAFERKDYSFRKSGMMGAADVMAPSIKVTGQHKGVISSIIQMPADATSDTPNCDIFLTGCSDGAIRMFSLSMLSEGRDEAVCTFDQGSSGVEQICAMTENSFLSSGHDNNVRLWDVRASDRQRLLEGANFGKVTWLQKYSPTIFASASNDGLVNFWDTRKMQLLTKVEIPSHGSICSIQFTKKRQYMIVAHDHKVSVINITANGGENSASSSSNTTKSQQQSFTVMANQEPPIPASVKQTQPAVATEDSWGNGVKLTSMIYNEAEKKVYTGSFNKKITVWNLNLKAFN